MTDQGQSSPTSAPSEPGQQASSRARRLLFMVVLALGAGLAGAVAATAAGGWGAPGFWHHGGFRGPGGFMGGPLDPAAVEDRADRVVRHLAVEIDATPDQQEKLRSIVRAAVKDLLPMRERARNARREARRLLTQPTIDRAAIEKLRSDQVAAFDTASKRLAQALTDVAEVLTPEQRTKVDEMLPPRGGYWWRWHRG